MFRCYLLVDITYDNRYPTKSNSNLHRNGVFNERPMIQFGK